MLRSLQRWVSTPNVSNSQLTDVQQLHNKKARICGSVGASLTPWRWKFRIPGPHAWSAYLLGSSSHFRYFFSRAGWNGRGGGFHTKQGGQPNKKQAAWRAERTAMGENMFVSSLHGRRQRHHERKTKERKKARCCLFFHQGSLDTVCIILSSPLPAFSKIPPHHKQPPPTIKSKNRKRPGFVLWPGCVRYSTRMHNIVLSPPLGVSRPVTLTNHAAAGNRIRWWKSETNVKTVILLVNNYHRGGLNTTCENKKRPGFYHRVSLETAVRKTLKTDQVLKLKSRPGL